MKRVILLLSFVAAAFSSKAQSYECLVGLYQGDFTNLDYGYSYSGAQLAIDYNNTYQENSGEFMNFAAYPNSGELIHFNPANDTIAFRYTNAVTQGIVQKITVGFRIETLSADSLVLRNDYLLCEYARTTQVDPNCTGMGGTTVGLQEVIEEFRPAELIGIYTMLGQEIGPEDLLQYKNTILVYLYSDGRIEKKLIRAQ